MSEMDLGVGISLGSAPASGAAANPNLLLWTEEFDDAVWAKTSCIVNADGGGVPAGQSGGNSDEVVSTGAGAAIRQTSATAATAGAAATATASFNPVFARYEVTGAFDGLDYTFSVWIKDASGGASGLSVVLRIDRSGGFLRASIEDAGGIEDYLAWGAQLEQASSASTYQHRGGT